MINFLKKILDIKTYNILILDDIKHNVELLDKYLKDIKNVKIYKSYDSLSAEDLIKKIKFDLLIFDIQMPMKDGFELTMNIKTDETNLNNKTPIIFITGVYESDMDKIKGYSLGSIDYILKPIRYDDFINKIKEYIKIGNDDILFTDIKCDNIKNSINI